MPLEGPFEIQKIQFVPKVICYLKGIEKRDQAEEMIPFDIYLQRSHFAPLEKGEVYLADLPGLKVQDSSGRAVGRVLDTYENGAQVILEVSWGDEKKDIPFVEAFVLGYDLDQGWIQLIPPEVIQ